jgi:hypothetical protein
MTGVARTVARASSAAEDFRGDYDRLAAMLQASWKQNATAPFLYTAEFLADCFRYPGSSFALAPTIYRGSEPIAFVVGQPRRVTIGDAERRILISTFLTVAPEHRSTGYGVVVWAELMRRAAQAGFDGVVNYCVDGEAMDRMIHGICRRLGLGLIRVASFSYLARSTWVPGGGELHPGPSAGELAEAAAAMPGQAGLSRLWSDDEAAWQLSRCGAVSVKAGSAPPPGVLTGYVISVADAVGTRCLVVDDVLWGDLVADDRPALVRDLVMKATAAGARMAIVPVLGYADPQPFVASGFVPSPPTTHAYLVTWSDPAPSRAPDRYYLDVI